MLSTSDKLEGERIQTCGLSCSFVVCSSHIRCKVLSIRFLSCFFLFGFSSKFVILSFDIFNNICKLMACWCCICSLKLMLSLCHYPSGVDRGDAARYWWTTADYWETSGDYWETTPGYSGKRKDIWYCLCLS